MGRMTSPSCCSPWGQQQRILAKVWGSEKPKKEAPGSGSHCGGLWLTTVCLGEPSVLRTAQPQGWCIFLISCFLKQFLGYRVPAGALVAIRENHAYSVQLVSGGLLVCFLSET